MVQPIKAKRPRLDVATIEWDGQDYSLPYFYREGSGPKVLFVHGLGGAKEDFYTACQSPALADCTIAAFDEPGTGLAAFDPEAGLDVSALADMTHRVATQLLEGPYFLAGASMGGLIALLLIHRQGLDQICGLINLEGNLASEDCMFSRRVVSQGFEDFSVTYQQMMDELRISRFAGDQIIAQHMALNIDIRAYYAYAFETVAASDSGGLLQRFIDLPIRRLFLYGAKNRTLSYLPKLRQSSVEVCEVPSAGHFLHLDNPIDTFDAIGSFMLS